jgi:hypothetical protein
LDTYPIRVYSILALRYNQGVAEVVPEIFGVLGAVEEGGTADVIGSRGESIGIPSLFDLAGPFKLDVMTHVEVFEVSLCSELGVGDERFKSNLDLFACETGEEFVR